MISQYLTKKPVLPSSVFIAPGAYIIGDVEMGEECSVWFNAVIRGDVNAIRIGKRTNIQDGAIIHVTLNTCPVTMGDEITVGHGAILHGCTVHDRVLIGMGAKVLDRAVIHSHCIIAAGALVKEGYEVPENTLLAGIPAKPIRSLTVEEIEKIERSANHYIEYAKTYCRLNPVCSFSV
jgi:carbonic anhydrase/acetyltransferase-like protein (isoleucine patch superfamily)